jgi:hypothetical protein
MTMMTLRLPNGLFCLAYATALHQRIPRRRRPYAKPTHWLAMTGSGQYTAWGRTRREAFNNLKTALGIHT